MSDGSGTEDLDFGLDPLALRAASIPSCRICAVIGLSAEADEGVDEGGGCDGEEGEGCVSVLSFEGDVVLAVDVGPAEGGLEGVLVVDAVWLEKERLSLISPYSFHSSTSSRSWLVSASRTMS